MNTQQARQNMAVKLCLKVWRIAAHVVGTAKKVILHTAYALLALPMKIKNLRGMMRIITNEQFTR
ncbi:MAG TPA: hypothetical protein DIW35_11645 [Psychrobacter sp.]|nr:hypothetical protein [Psychrobacter sp.]